MFKNWKRKAKGTVRKCIQITEDNRNKNDKECLRNQKVGKKHLFCDMKLLGYQKQL